MEILKTDKQLNEKYLLKKGDIIMRLTPPYTARTIEFDDENITTTSNYAIIKVKNNYPPELLTFYLNSEYTKEQIYKFSEQTSIKVINITNIKNFNIKIEEPVIFDNALYKEELSIMPPREEDIEYISDEENVFNHNIDKEELYTQLVKIHEEKKKLIEKQLKLEKDLIEEIIFGE